MTPSYARTSLDGADFHEAYLVGADFFAASVRRGNFVRADLRGANLCCANFAQSRFIRADLRGANLRSAALSGCDLRAADLRGAALTWCDLEGAWLWGATVDRNPKRRSRDREYAELLGFPSFADALEQGYWHVRRRPTYWDLKALEGVMFRPDLDLELVAMLWSVDGRHHLLAAAALMFYSPPIAVEAAWERLAAGSWASVQLRAALNVVDPASRDPAVEHDPAAARWLQAFRNFEQTPL